MWENDFIKGYGVLCRENGERYEGGHKKFLKEGFGTKTFPDGRVHEGMWKNNMRHGTGIYSYILENGCPISIGGTWDNDELEDDIF